MPSPHNILSIDVEEWFHILELSSTPTLSEWDKLENRIEKNFSALLKFLDAHQTKATFFTLGWVAERYPHLVRDAAKAGHEIASHGYGHQIVHTQTRKAFYDDIKKAKDALESASNQKVLGYRAPGFSITKETPWAFEEIARAGYVYDSSVFPGKHGHGGIADSPLAPYDIQTPFGVLHEFPATVVELLGRRACFFGGGYLRLFPYPLIKKMSRRVEGEGRGVVFYLHPREIDPDHPRLKMGLLRYFKSYTGLASTLPKLKRLIEDFRPVRFQDCLSPILAEKAACPR